MVKFLISNVLFPLHEHAKGHQTLAMLEQMERVQFLSQSEIQEVQQQKLQQLLTQVRDNVPFFAGSEAYKGEFATFPLLSKKSMRENVEAFKARNAGELVRSNTGGSSGEPLIFYMGKRRISADVAAKVRSTRWWGVDIGDPEIVVWGSPVELSKQDRIRQLRDRLFRTTLLSAFDMTPETMLSYLQTIRSVRPRHVFGYPSSISLLADFARKNHIRLDDLGVKVVFCTSERLYDHQRVLISETFGAPVANGYGARDAGFIAHECPQGKLHVCDDIVLVEIIDANGRVLPPGQTGEIVITHLESHEFPFIRYRTGDVGALSGETCSCGRGLRVLKSLEGRSTDFIVLPGGKSMHALALIYVVRDIPGVQQFKFVQEDFNRIRLLLDVAEGYGKEQEQFIRAGLEKRLGPGVCLELEYVEQIAPEKSGKFRYVESKVAV